MALKQMFAECFLRVSIGIPCYVTVLFLTQMFLGKDIIVLNPGIFNVQQHNNFSYVKAKLLHNTNLLALFTYSLYHIASKMSGAVARYYDKGKQFLPRTWKTEIQQILTKTEETLTNACHKVS